MWLKLAFHIQADKIAFYAEKIHFNSGSENKFIIDTSLQREF